MSIGAVARLVGVTSRRIRQYHAAGLMPEPPRDAAGHRRYAQQDLERLQEIVRLRARGIPVDQIAKLPGGSG